MRTIKFRAKIAKEHLDKLVELELFDEYDKEKNEFIHGFPIIDGSENYLIDGIADATQEYFQPEYWTPIDKETLGQFTGLLDKNGTEIYEGDICIVHDSLYKGSVVNVTYNEELLSWCIDESMPMYLYSGDGLNKNIVLEVIGNIHDNPELLKGEK